MGKILQFPSPEQKANHGEEEKDRADDLANPDSEIVSLRSRMRLEGPPPKEFIPKLTLVLADLGTLVQQVPASRRNNVGPTYQSMVKKYTPEELVNYIMQANEHKLAEKPLFYKAIVEELEEREIIDI